MSISRGPSAKCEVRHPAALALRLAVVAKTLRRGLGVFTYTDLDGASWTSWVVGVIAVLLGGSVAATSNRAQQATQH